MVKKERWGEDRKKQERTGEDTKGQYEMKKGKQNAIHMSKV